MAYDVWRFYCSNKEHGVMDYEGEGNYVCPVCGETYHDDFFDEDENDDSECISVDEAALIWLSNGKDEDYMFGYTEEELEAAL